VDLDDSVVIITGGGTGIGAASARAVSAHGAHVVLAGRRPDRIAQVADELRAARPDRTALAVATDVTVRADVRALAAVTLETFGRIDVLVNNAGQGIFSPVAEANLDFYEQLLAVNVVGPLAMMQAVIPTMRAQGRGTIVNVSSVVALGPSPIIGPYASTKVALDRLTAVARMELAADGIVVSTIYPFQTESEFRDALLSDHPDVGVAPVTHTAQYVATRLVELIRSGDESVILAPE
jgi:short-subunit dehydrogenase